MSIRCGYSPHTTDTSSRSRGTNSLSLGHTIKVVTTTKVIIPTCSLVSDSVSSSAAAGGGAPPNPPNPPNSSVPALALCSASCLAANSTLNCSSLSLSYCVLLYGECNMLVYYVLYSYHVGSYCGEHSSQKNNTLHYYTAVRYVPHTCYIFWRHPYKQTYMHIP